MTEQPAAAALTGGVELLERAIAYTRGNLQLVTPSALPERTPCDRWDLATLLSHMEDSLDALCEAADVGRIELDAEAGSPCSGAAATRNVCNRLRMRAIRLLNWSATALGDEPIAIAEQPLTASIVTATGALEITTHGWDVAQACGADRPIPTELAEQLLAVAPLLVTDADRPSRFAAVRCIPAGATASDRLLAFLGRESRR